MKLLIVESPAKTRKIREFLGQGYAVAASFGHVRDLPVQGGLAVAFRDGLVLPTYVQLEKAQRAVEELRRLAARASEILLATDPDREGEAIAWHVAALLAREGEGKPVRRVVFHAITKPAVLAAVAAPRALDQHLVDAQQARRVLDRVVGWLVSPTLRVVSRDARSAGRVQSVALRLVAEREREIQAFTAVDYRILAAQFAHPAKPPPFPATLMTWKSEPLAQRLTDPALAEKTVAWCRAQPFVVQSCERRETQRHAPPPFTTATVTQAASVRLKMAPDATMRALQTLFEGGHITYHRTDSTALAPEAIAAARALVAAQFPKSYLPAAPIVHATAAANAQEAHEAIRPTHPETGADALAHTPEGALYRLIWERFIACQMSPGRDAITTIAIACAPGAWQGGPVGVFQAKGIVVLFDGWRRLTADSTEEKKPRRKAGDPASEQDEARIALPLLDPGDTVQLLNLKAEARTTKPPPRLTAAGLIKRLEREGVGRPSTYAAILRTITERGYVEERKRLLHATALGCSLIDFLVARYAGNFIEPGFTARMESALDAIARGERAWQPTITAAAEEVLRLAQSAGLRGDPLREG